MGSHGQHLTRCAGCLLHGQTQADVPSLLLVPRFLHQARATELCPEVSITPVVSEHLFYVGAWPGVSTHCRLVSLPLSLQAVGYPPVSASGLPVSGDGRNGWRAVCSSPLGPGNGCSFAQQSKEGKVYFNVELSFRCCFP